MVEYLALPKESILNTNDCFSKDESVRETLFKKSLFPLNVWYEKTVITLGRLSYLFTVFNRPKRRQRWGCSGRSNVQYKYFATVSHFQRPQVVQYEITVQWGQEVIYIGDQNLELFSAAYRFSPNCKDWKVRPAVPLIDPSQVSDGSPGDPANWTKRRGH